MVMVRPKAPCNRPPATGDTDGRDGARTGNLKVSRVNKLTVKVPLRSMPLVAVLELLEIAKASAAWL